MINCALSGRALKTEAVLNFFYRQWVLTSFDF